jgi:DNA uptake protein ComE-like DNA-binding protein
MPTNINDIGRPSSKRLAQALTMEISDEIIQERGRNGDCQSFDNLQDRVHGLGPVKIKKLKEAGFVCT